MENAKAKWFRVKVTDLRTNLPKVSINLPMSLVEWGIRTGSKVGGKDLCEMGINFEELREAISSGLRGKVIDVIDEQKAEHVEITIE